LRPHGFREKLSRWDMLVRLRFFRIAGIVDNRLAAKGAQLHGGLLSLIIPTSVSLMRFSHATAILRGTIRDHAAHQRRSFLRFFRLRVSGAGAFWRRRPERVYTLLKPFTALASLVPTAKESSVPSKSQRYNPERFDGTFR